MVHVGTATDGHLYISIKYKFEDNLKFVNIMFLRCLECAAAGIE